MANRLDVSGVDLRQRHRQPITAICTMKLSLAKGVVACLLTGTALAALPSLIAAAESPPARASGAPHPYPERLQWWAEARFGLFVLPGGVGRTCGRAKACYTMPLAWGRAMSLSAQGIRRDRSVWRWVALAGLAEVSGAGGQAVAAHSERADGLFQAGSWVEGHACRAGGGRWGNGPVFEQRARGGGAGAQKG